MCVTLGPARSTNSSQALARYMVRLSPREKAKEPLCLLYVFKVMNFVQQPVKGKVSAWAGSVSR